MLVHVQEVESEARRAEDRIAKVQEEKTQALRTASAQAEDAARREKNKADYAAVEAAKAAAKAVAKAAALAAAKATAEEAEKAATEAARAYAWAPSQISGATSQIS